MKLFKVALAGLLVIGAGAAGLMGSGTLLDRFMAEEGEAAGDARPERVARVSTATSTRGAVRRTAEAIGSTEAVRSIDVQTMADGRLTDVAFVEGADVEEGQRLIQLDDRAEQAALKEADASLNEARGNLERARSLAEQNIQSDATLEANEALVLRAEALREQAVNAVSDRQVVAPFAGTVGLASVDVGQMITTSTILTSLDDLSEIEVTFSLPEAYFAEVSQGQTIVASSDAYGERTFEGRVSAIGTRIDAASRSFQVRATIPNDDRALVSGMFMGVSIVLEERESVSVPEVAVVNEGDATYLYTVRDGTAERRDVEIGIRQDGRVEILEGLDEDAPVVVSGLQNIDDGDRVEALAEGAPAVAEAADVAPTAPAREPLG